MSTRYYFERMEEERARVPFVLKEEYFPTFVVNYLRELLEDSSSDDGVLERLELLSKKKKDSPEWGDDSFFEDNPDVHFEGEFLLTPEKRDEVYSILSFAEDMFENFFLDKQKLRLCIADGMKYPSMELLYILDSCNILPVSVHLLNLVKVMKLDVSRVLHFKRQFSAFYRSRDAFSVEKLKISSKILRLFLTRILTLHYCNPRTRNVPELVDVLEVTGEMLGQIVKKLFCDDCTKLDSSNHQILLASLNNAETSCNVKRKFFVDHIKMYLRSGSEPFLSPTDVLQRQEEFAEPTKLLELENFAKSISEMIKRTLTADDALSIISSSLCFSGVNWEILLYFTSIWIQKKGKEATGLLKELIKSQLREGLQFKDDTTVFSGFILARHCSLVSAENFTRYEKWFANTFESEMYSPANDLESFQYLTKLLTEWIPCEPCCFLRVHSTFRPFVPKGCRDIWNDYLQLARARIAEFKEMEQAVEYVPNKNDPIQHQVTMVLKSFEKYKKIPNYLRKLFIFQRQEYYDSFLPALLRKPNIIEADAALTDSRLRVIEMLNKEGRIPADLYAQYRASR